MRESESAAGSPGTAALADLTVHRASIVRVLLRGFVALGLVAYVPSMWAAVENGAWAVAVVDTVVFAGVVAAWAFGGRYPRVQAGVLVGSSWLLGTVLGITLGPIAAGPLWLAATPIVAAS